MIMFKEWWLNSSGQTIGNGQQWLGKGYLMITTTNNDHRYGTFDGALMFFKHRSLYGKFYNFYSNFLIILQNL